MNKAGAKKTTELVFPEKLAADRWIAIALFVASCAYLWIFRRYTSMDPDEGIVLEGAERILRGEVLYRDFFAFITPGSYYWHAVIFRVFGDSLAVAHTALVLYGGVFVVFTYFLVRRVCARWSSLLTAYLLILTCLPWRFMTLHNWDSTLWLCLAVYCAIRFVEAPRVVWAFGTGTLTSLTFLFEQSKGVGLLLGLLVALVILARKRQQIDSSLLLAFGFAFAAGLVWPIAGTLSYFAGCHALKDLLAAWVWPLQHYSVVNKVPYGYADWSDQIRQSLFHSGDRLQDAISFMTISPYFLVPALPILGLILFVRWLVKMRQGTLALNEAAYYVMVCSAIGGALLSIIAVRPNITHFVYLAPLFYIVLAWILDARAIGGSLLPRIQPIVVALVFVTFTAIGMASLVSARSARAAIETRRGAIRTGAPDDFISFVQASLLPGEKVFIYPYFPLGYYLTGLRNASRYEYLQPGMHTREQTEQVVREIKSQKTDVVLFEPQFSEKIYTSWPNTPVPSVAVDPVADYIVQNYRSCSSLVSGGKAHFAFMVRDGLNCPPTHHAGE